jgi:hypothetical protein
LAGFAAAFGNGFLAEAGAFFAEAFEAEALEAVALERDRRADFDEALAMASVTIERFREQAAAYNTLFCCSASGQRHLSLQPWTDQALTGPI